MARLGDYIEQIRGVSYKPEDICSSTDNDAAAILRANNIQDDGLNFDDLLYIKESKISDKQYIQKGDIVVCASSGSKNLVGKAAIASENFPVAFGAFCKVVRPKKLIPSYIGYFFQSPKYRSTISELSGGANINNIRNEHIDELDIVIVSEKEQESIVNQLDDLSNLISLRKQQLSKFDELVKSRFIELFGDPDTNPLGWNEDVLSEHLEVVGGYAFKSDKFEDEGIPVLRIGNINSGRFLPVNMVYWNDDPTLERYKMYSGDLVMSLTGTVGKDDYGNVCILGADYPEYFLNQRNAKLSLKPTLDAKYLSELLKFERIKRRLTGISRGVRQANISNKDILCLCVPIAPINLQNQFAAFVEQTDKSKLAVQQSLETLETLKKSLMQKYFG